MFYQAVHYIHLPQLCSNSLSLVPVLSGPSPYFPGPYHFSGGAHSTSSFALPCLFFLSIVSHRLLSSALPLSLVRSLFLRPHCLLLVCLYPLTSWLLISLWAPLAIAFLRECSLHFLAFLYFGRACSILCLFSFSVIPFGKFPLSTNG